MARLDGAVVEAWPTGSAGTYSHVSPDINVSGPFVVDEAFVIGTYDMGAPIVDLGIGTTSDWSGVFVALGTHGLSWESAVSLNLARHIARQRELAALADALEHQTAHLSVIRRAARNSLFGELAAYGSMATALALIRLTGDAGLLWLAFLQATVPERPAIGTESIADAATAWRAWGRARGLL